MSKTLERLLERAQLKGEAILNGRMSYHGYKGDLEEKYAISIENDILELRHWGTTTLVINTSNQTILEWYGESNSDRDSMNFILSKFDINGRFKYRPSIDEFSLVEKEELK